jgi:hypothetical protein
MSLVGTKNAARWNYNRGILLLNATNHEKNNDKRERLFRDAGHHLTVGDNCRRTAFLLEKSQKGGRRGV